MRNRLTVATGLVLLGLIAGIERPVAQPAPMFGQPPPYLPGFGPPPQPPAVEAPPARRIEAPPARRIKPPPARRVEAPAARTGKALPAKRAEVPAVRRGTASPTRRVQARPARPTAIRPEPAQRKPSVARTVSNLRKVAEAKGFKPVSDLVNFPKFFPGLGIVFVQPDTLPLGPFLCFDRKDGLVATVYMVPMTELKNHKTLEAPAFAGRADHVSIYFNAGHPGVDTPHYHFVIWHVSKGDEARVAK